MTTPSVVARIHARGRRRPETVDREDLQRLREYMDPDVETAETVGLALEAVNAAVDADPDAGVVAVPPLVDLLDADDPALRSGALSALVAVSEAHPETLSSAVDRVAARASDADDDARRARLLLLLARLAEADPGAVLPAAGTVVDCVEDGSAAVRANATRAAAALAGADPAAVRPAVPALVETLDAGVAGPRIDAARALAAVPEGDPGTLADHVDALFAALADDSPAVRDPAMRAVAELAMADPPAVADRADDLLSRLGDPAVGTTAVEAVMGVAVVDPGGTARALATVDPDGEGPARENAERALRGIAMRNPAPVVRALGSVLDHGTSAVRHTAASVLCAVAEHRPERTAPVVDELVGRLDDDPSVARAAAAAVRATAAERPDAVAPLADELAAALGPDPSPAVTGALAAVAGSDPDAVEWSELPAETLFGAGDEAVRADACRIAGRAAGAGVLDRLRDLTDDDAEAVRVAALEAMAALDRRGVAALTEADRERIEGADGADGAGEPDR